MRPYKIDLEVGHCSMFDTGLLAPPEAKAIWLRDDGSVDIRPHSHHKPTKGAEKILFSKCMALKSVSRSAVSAEQMVIIVLTGPLCAIVLFLEILDVTLYFLAGLGFRAEHRVHG